MTNLKKIAFIRGAFFNPWEWQNYEPLVKQFSFTVFTSFHSLFPMFNQFLTPGVRVKKMFSPMDLPNFPGKMPILNRLTIDAHWLWGLGKELIGFDLAHVAETYYAYTHQALMAKKQGVIKKVVSTSWEIIPHNNEGIWGRKKWKQEALRKIDLFICPTNLAKRCLIEEGCEAKKIKVIRMGVDLDKFKMQKTKFKINENNLRILFVGRMEKEKGIWELLKAFEELRRIYKNIFLTLVGKGSAEEEIKKFLIKSKIKKFVLLKNGVNYEKISKEYQKADIFVLPSKSTKTWQEQYGMVLVEAMASGLPIVASKSGAIPEVVGEVALLVEPGKPKELIKTLKFLIENPNKRKELGRQARKKAEREFDNKKISQKIKQLYNQILVG